MLLICFVEWNLSNHLRVTVQDAVDGTDDRVTDKAQRVAYEMLTTEKAYVEKLHLIDQVILASAAVKNRR